MATATLETILSPAPMTKAEEKDLYRKFILATPLDSYLRSVLSESQGFVFGNIDNDIAWPVQELASVTASNIKLAQTALADVKASIKAAEDKLKLAQREIRDAKYELSALLTNTQKFINMADEAKFTLRDAVKAMTTLA